MSVTVKVNESRRLDRFHTMALVQLALYSASTETSRLCACQTAPAFSRPTKTRLETGEVLKAHCGSPDASRLPWTRHDVRAAQSSGPGLLGLGDEQERTGRDQELGSRQNTRHRLRRRDRERRRETTRRNTHRGNGTKRNLR